jgi:hypothetical protein
MLQDDAAASGEIDAHVAGTGTAAKDAAGNTDSADGRKAQEGADYVVDSGGGAKDSVATAAGRAANAASDLLHHDMRKAGEAAQATQGAAAAQEAGGVFNTVKDKVDGAAEAAKVLHNIIAPPHFATAVGAASDSALLIITLLAIVLALALPSLVLY